MGLPVAGRWRRWSSDAVKRGDDHVVIATMLQPNSTVGVSTHVVQVADLLAKTGQGVRIVTPQSLMPWTLLILLAPGRVFARPGSESAVRLNRYLHRRFMQFALQREFRRDTPALVYAQDPRTAHAALKARRSSAVPIVMVVHYNESQAEELVERNMIPREGNTYRSIRGYEARILPRLDGLVFVSNYMLDHLRSRVPVLSDVPSAVVPNFVEAVENLATEPRMADCISVGSLVRRKNHGYLLRVLAAARDRGHRYTLTIVGDGPERKALQRLTQELNLDDQVLFTGRRHDVEMLLPRHRVYVHSSTMDNFPFALIEALRSGLPIVAGAVGGIPELVGAEGAGRFWDLADPIAGARVLSELLHNEVALAAASDAASVRFKREFDAAVAGKELMRFFAAIRDKRT